MSGHDFSPGDAPANVTLPVAPAVPPRDSHPKRKRFAVLAAAGVPLLLAAGTAGFFFGLKQGEIKAVAQQNEAITSAEAIARYELVFGNTYPRLFTQDRLYTDDTVARLVSPKNLAEVAAAPTKIGYQIVIARSNEDGTATEKPATPEECVAALTAATEEEKKQSEEGSPGFTPTVYCNYLNDENNEVASLTNYLAGSYTIV